MTCKDLEYSRHSVHYLNHHYDLAESTESWLFSGFLHTFLRLETGKTSSDEFSLKLSHLIP